MTVSLSSVSYPNCESPSCKEYRLYIYSLGTCTHCDHKNYVRTLISFMNLERSWSNKNLIYMNRCKQIIFK